MRHEFALWILSVMAIIFIISIAVSVNTNNPKIFEDTALILAAMAGFILGALTGK